MSYVRFTTCESRFAPERRGLRRRGDDSFGLFETAYGLRESGQLDPRSQDLFDATIGWFESYLHVPRLRRSYRGALFWFRSECDEMLTRAWTLTVVLQDYRVCVRQHSTTDPGYICYADLHQVAALPRHITRLRRPEVAGRSR